GPLAGWHGKVGASAGALARLDADVSLAVAAETALGVSGTASMAPLLPSEFAALVGDRAALSLDAGLGEQVVVRQLSIEIAAGKLTGHAAVGGPRKRATAHLNAELPELSRLAGLLGQSLSGSANLAATVTGTESRPSLELRLSGTGIGFGPSGAERLE